MLDLAALGTLHMRFTVEESGCFRIGLGLAVEGVEGGVERGADHGLRLLQCGALGGVEIDELQAFVELAGLGVDSCHPGGSWEKRKAATHASQPRRLTVALPLFFAEPVNASLNLQTPEVKISKIYLMIVRNTGKLPKYKLTIEV